MIDALKSFLEIFPLGFISFFRISISYLISSLLAMLISYLAFYSRRLEKILIPAVDIMQSVPVLSFTPGVMLIFFGLGRAGFELGAIILIITSIIWNLIFSFYTSLKNIPKEFDELSKILNVEGIRKFFLLHLPFSLPQFLWNSLLSFGNAWYFLMYCEMFSIGELEIKVDGIGAFILNSMERGEITNTFYGFLVILFIISASYFLIWKPLLLASLAMKFEEEPEEEILARMNILDKFYFQILKKLIRAEQFFSHLNQFLMSKSSKIGKFFDYLSFLILFAVGVFLLLIFRFFLRLELSDVLLCIVSIFPTLLRVSLGIFLASLLAIPLAILIGTRWKPYQEKIVSVIQIISSFPVPAVIPFVFPFFLRLPMGLEMNALFIISTSSVWYIFYNTLAGVNSIPKELFLVGESLRMSLKDKLRQIILKGSRKDMLVGFITAWGGAWNGTFVAESIIFREKEYKIFGIGSLIFQSAREGKVELMIFSTFVMCGFIVLFNIFVWRKLLEEMKD
ncbi:Putative aliphatic sulfonates transport permease protein SsuC [bacterium HR19]|nr:Putative aliphatic sulfonates transport permease protein SsuC [bacterium HR19]